MQASFFLDTCKKSGIDFYSGVPDSLLKALCNELFVRYGTDNDAHIVAHAVIHHYLTCRELAFFAVDGELTFAAFAKKRAQISSFIALSKAEPPHIGYLRSVDIKKDELHTFKRMITCDFSAAWQGKLAVLFVVAFQHIWVKVADFVRHYLTSCQCVSYV